MSSCRFNNGQRSRGWKVWERGLSQAAAAPTAEETFDFQATPVSSRLLRVGTTRGSISAAFTLLELLVVIAIIGVLAAVGLNGISGFGKSNATISATRQLLDDIALARSLAMSTRSDIYMVFVGHAERNLVRAAQTSPGGINLLGGQYNTYALYAERTVGDQPGRSNPRYLTPWKTLPQGTFIATNKFIRPAPTGYKLDGVSPFEFTSIPFPQATNSPKTLLPCIVFTSRGQLKQLQRPPDNGGEIIPLARGSIFYKRDADGKITIEPNGSVLADVSENPPFNSRKNFVLPNGSTNTMWNWVHIDGLTSRARVERQEIQ